MPNSKQIVYLSQAQYAELIANGSITVDGVTVTYDENDIYVTPQAEPVTDVRVAGTSVTSNGVANIPVMSSSNFGVAKVGDFGVGIGTGGLSNYLVTVPASSTYIKRADNGNYCVYRPISPRYQHESVYYGLAKAAGADMANVTGETVGTYPDEQKSAIQQMLGVSDLLAPRETSYIASQAYAVGDIFTLNGKLYKVTTAIAESGAIVVQDDGESVSGANAIQCKLGEETIKDVRINGVSVIVDGVAKIPKAAVGVRGAVKLSNAYGIQGYGSGDAEAIGIIPAGDTKIKQSTDNYACITPYNQHKSTFYALAKAAGADMRLTSGETVGVYPDAQKAAIQHMLGTDTNLADYESDTTADAAYAIGELFMLNGKLHQATAAIAIGDTLTVGTNCSVVNAADVFPHDVQVNGTSVVSSGVASIPEAGVGTFGVCKVHPDYGITILAHTLYINSASEAQTKAGADNNRPITSARQHLSAFYGLAKASGDTTQSASSNAVGAYTDNAKASIKSMLGIVDGSTSTVSVTGTTPSITAVENTRYTCGEVSTLTITPPASGICIIRFTSGTTPTVLTATGVVWPAWFDATDLEADTTYEICITDGYGAVMSWAL